MVLTRCSTESEVSTPAAPAPESTVVVRVPTAGDPGLTLYRNPAARALVIDFYTREVGNPEVVSAILTAADRYDIALPLAFSLAWTESRYRVTARNRNLRSTDRGLYQLNSATFPSLTEQQFFDPSVNARYGLAHLRFCLREGGNTVVGLAMYNAGTYGVRKGTPLSTLHYVAAVLEHRDELESLFTREVLERKREGIAVVMVDP